MTRFNLSVLACALALVAVPNSIAHYDVGENVEKDRIYVKQLDFKNDHDDGGLFPPVDGGDGESEICLYVLYYHDGHDLKDFTPPAPGGGAGASQKVYYVDYDCIDVDMDTGDIGHNSSDTFPWQIVGPEGRFGAGASRWMLPPEHSECSPHESWGAHLVAYEVDSDVADVLSKVSDLLDEALKNAPVPLSPNLDRVTRLVEKFIQVLPQVKDDDLGTVPVLDVHGEDGTTKVATNFEMRLEIAHDVEKTDTPCPTFASADPGLTPDGGSAVHVFGTDVEHASAKWDELIGLIAVLDGMGVGESEVDPEEVPATKGILIQALGELSRDVAVAEVEYAEAKEAFPAVTLANAQRLVEEADGARETAIASQSTSALQTAFEKDREAFALLAAELYGNDGEEETADEGTEDEGSTQDDEAASTDGDATTTIDAGAEEETTPPVGLAGILVALVAAGVLSKRR